MTSGDLEADLYRLRTVDGEEVDLVLGDFFLANELHLEDEREIRALSAGQTYRGGGGAAPAWSITRLGSDPSACPCCECLYCESCGDCIGCPTKPDDIAEHFVVDLEIVCGGCKGAALPRIMSA